MRRINNKSTKLEHIIPQSIEKEKDIKPYLKYGRLRRKWIILRNKIDLTRRLHTPPYPHFIAYENLVASCDGKIEPEAPFKSHCCNSYRGNDFVVPVFYLSNASILVEYNAENGLAFSFFTKSDKAIDAVNLNHTTLLLMRKAWAKVTTLDYSLNDLRLAERDENLRNDIVDDLELNLFREDPTLRIETYWTLFLQYDWFYQYFLGRTI
jgi:hypothetical protein